MSDTFDAIVLGLGGMGSAAAYHLARRGRRVLGLDAHAPGHSHGSSHGRSRIIREAYAEAPAYVPVVRRAFALWRELEAETGRALLTITGLVNIGPADAAAASGVLESARRYDIACEVLSPAEMATRFPAFRLADDQAAIYQPNAGFLRPEDCTAAHLALAARHGSVLRHAEPARRWAADGAGVVVETDAGTYRADRLVVTAGPWAAEALAGLGLPLTVTRMVNVHFEPTDPARFAPERCPVWGLDLADGEYYGIPALPGEGVKIGRHDGGEVCQPATARRVVGDDEVAQLRSVLDRHLPGAAGAVKWTLTCLYTMTPDGHFILDRHPAHPQVAFGCGFSGHGFKFASAIGEIMADLALDGTTAHDISFLSAARFGIGQR